MTIRYTDPVPQKGWFPLVLLVLLTVGVLVISVFSLVSGWVTIFQNLFYFPIILACVYYGKRGFVFSVILAWSYFLLMVIFSPDQSVFGGAFIRVLIFILVAGVITYLSINRIRAEEKLKESEDRFRTMANSTYDWEYWINQNRDLVYLSPSVERITGYPSEDFIADSELINRIVHPEDRIRWEEHLRVHTSTEKKDVFAEIEFRIITKDGTLRWISHNCRPIFGDGGLFRGRRVSNCDVTECRQAEEALSESSLKLRLLTGLTRHDILNQVTALQLLLDMALNSSNLQKIHEYTTHARQASDQIEKTIGFTREYESFGTSSSGWQRIYQLIESAKEEISLGGITIENQIPDDLTVYADAIIRKVFSTLMENAIRHGGEIRNIRFFCSDRENTLIITCEDDGVGVPLEEKGSIFDHGYGKNTGIGLFLSKEILSITGLSIRECGVEGRGSRFEIVVPVGKFRMNSDTPCEYGGKP